MRVPRTFLVLLFSAALAVGVGGCVVEEGSGENPTTTTGLVPNDSPGESNNVPADPNTQEPGPTDEGGGTQDDPGAGAGGGQTND